MRRGASSTWILVGLWIIAVVGVISGSLWITSAQNAAAQNLSRMVQQVEQAVERDDWARAEQELHALRRTWERTRKTWSFHTEHEAMDHVTDALTEVEGLVKLQDVQALPLLHLARDRITTLPERDVLSLENLF